MPLHDLPPAEFTATVHDNNDNDTMHEPLLEEDDVLSAEQIVELLDRKRRQLDAQIERFKVLKEQEYRAHEHWLKKTARQRDLRSNTAAHDSRSNGNQQNSLAPSRGEGMQSEGQKQHATVGSLFDKRPVGPISPLASDGQQNFEAIAKQQHNQRSPPETPHEREAEFAGVFTPSFLPLLDGSTDDRNGGGVASAQPTLHIKDETLASTDTSAHHTDMNPTTNSSTHHPTDHPPTQPPHLSIITPPPTSPSQQQEPPTNNHARSTSTSSSTKSDASSSHSRPSSRRSSFKSPHTNNNNNSTPRSPKRVMFDIDNTVVSPSTSPLVERQKAPLTKTRSGTKVNGDNNNGEEEQFEIVRKKPPPSSFSSSSSSKQKKHASHHHHHHHHRKGHRVAGEGRHKPPQPAKEGDADGRAEAFTVDDDFEKVSAPVGLVGGGDGEEDLFAFDEDLEVDLGREVGVGAQREKWMDGDGFGGGGGDEDGEVDGGGAEDENGDGRRTATVLLTGSSPHAGSLPIEIRWPGRRGDGGPGGG